VSVKKQIRCAIYTRKSSEEGLEQSFNSLHAQREACEAYIKSQRHEGWVVVKDQYDDGGFSGGNVDRPALSTLLEAIQAKQVDIIIVYKVDRLSRSLSDFVRLVDLFDQHGVSFVSVTQQFNTSTSMGRLTLNVLLSFAQFEREITGERIRDKIAASKRKGMWMGGTVPLGYDIQDKQLIINDKEAKLVRLIFDTYIEVKCVCALKERLERLGHYSKQNKPFSRGALYTILKNPLYIGKVRHKNKLFDGLHEPILEESIWQQVQATLHYNQHAKKHRVNSKQPSLLAGLLVDDQGNAMSPSHATKNNRRYRYYISQALLQYQTSSGGSVLRVAAREIEQPVIGAILELLQSPKQLGLLFKDSLENVLAHENLVQIAQTMASDWKTLSPSQQILYMQEMIERVVVSRKQLSIELKLAGLGKCLGLELQEDATHIIKVPIELRRCGMEMKVIIPNNEDQAIDPSSLEAIQQGLAQALTWNEQLLNGKVASIQNIARKEELDRSYVVRRLRLAFLAPDIITSIFDGRIPPQLSLTKLRNGFPLEWDQQRRHLGFTETLAQS